jgi:hypothetical protein
VERISHVLGGGTDCQTVKILCDIEQHVRVSFQIQISAMKYRLRLNGDYVRFAMTELSKDICNQTGKYKLKNLPHSRKWFALVKT